MINKNDIKIDLSRDALFPPIAIQTLKDRYLLPDETSPQHALARASVAFADDLDHAQRIYDYVSQHYFMFSTPILSNGGTNKGLGISCFGANVEDSISGITTHYSETTFLATRGGGTSGGWSDLRSTGKGSKSNGTIPFIRVMDSLMLAANQTDTRRGSYAAYLHVSHPEIESFLIMRIPHGDHNLEALGIGFHNAVVIPNAFMEAVEADGDWNLIDPHSKIVTKTLRAKDLWKKILSTRVKTGEPYLLFEDTVNDYYPLNLKKKGLKVSHSNLCNEIMLHSGIDYAGKNRTFICCLSSVNIATYDQWKDIAPQMYQDLIRFLDNVLQHFIENAPSEVEQAVYSATMTRDLGLGTMGFHSYLQYKSIPFESSKAIEFNNEFYYYHSKYSKEASQKLGEEKGYYPDAYDSTGKLIHKQRNATVNAIAPNASSGIICGNVSPSIEAYDANAFKQSTLSGSFLTKNPNLEKVLEGYGKNTEEVWKDIIAHDGSVQHLDFLTDHEKLVYKTAFEMDQMWVVELAAGRQLFLDQGQSLNVFFDPGLFPDTSEGRKTYAKYVNQVHWSMWKKGCKGAYYLRTRGTRGSEKLTIVKSREVVDPNMITCSACEG